MSQWLPNFKFTVISDIATVSTLGSIGNPWVNIAQGSSANWTDVPNGISVSGTNPAQSISSVLSRPANQVTPIGSKAKINIGMFVGPAITRVNVYYLGPGGKKQAIHSITLGANQSHDIIFNVDVKAARYNDFCIEAIPLVAGPWSATINYFYAAKIDGTFQEVRPGGFKTLNLNLERSLDYWGLNFLVTGEFELVGDDARYLSGLLKSDPSYKVKLKIEINNVVIGTFLIDTRSIVFSGYADGYKGTFTVLKDNEWTQMLSAISTEISLGYPYSTQGYAVPDTAGNIDVIEPEEINPGQFNDVEFQQKFEGKALPQVSVAIQGRETSYVGFGNDTVRNDDFSSPQGLSREYSLKPNIGRLVQMVGTVTLTWTQTIAQIQISAYGATGWQPITSGVPFNIGINTYDNNLAAGWGLRIFNSANNQGEVTITSGTLNVTTIVRYDRYGFCIHPLVALKGFTDRLMGPYNNLKAPVFDITLNRFVVGFTSLLTMNPPPNNAMLNPPFTGLGYAVGNQPPLDVETTPFIYNPSVDVITIQAVNVPAGGKTDLWVAPVSVALAVGGNTYTSVMPRGEMTLTIPANGNLAAFNYTLFGINGDDIEPLFTVGDFNPVNFTTNKNYNKFAIQLINVSGAPASINLVQPNINYRKGVTQPVGKYAFNYLGAGNLTRQNISALGQVPSGEPPLVTSLDTLLTGLSRIFGLAVYETFNAQGKPVLTIDELSSVFLPADSAYTFELNLSTATLDPDLLFDTVVIGSPERGKYLFDSQSSCEETRYVGTFSDTGRVKDMLSPILLDPLYILGDTLNQNDVFLINMGKIATGDLDILGTNKNEVRILRNITLANTVSPKQLNWVHHEARITRRNELVLFSNKTRYLRIISGSEANQTVVNFALDTFGAIADANLILGTGAMSPFLYEFETDMTPEEFQVVFADKYRRFNLSLPGQVIKGRIKSLNYNPASGRALCKFWLTA